MGQKVNIDALKQMAEQMKKSASPLVRRMGEAMAKHAERIESKINKEE